MKRYCYLTKGGSYLRISTSQITPDAQFYKTRDSNTTRVWSVSTCGVSSWSNMLHKHTQNLGPELAWSSQTAGCKRPCHVHSLQQGPHWGHHALKWHRACDSDHFSYGETLNPKIFICTLKFHRTWQMAENVSVHASLNPETTTEQGKLIKAQLSWESSPRRVTKGLPGDSVGRSQNWQVHSRCRGEVSKTSRNKPSRGQKDTASTENSFQMWDGHMHVKEAELFCLTKERRC